MFFRTFTVAVLLTVTTCTQIVLSKDDVVTVNTKLGAIRGKAVHFEGSTAYAFLGIPFAKPPVGPLRFKKTEPAEKFDQVFDAFSPGHGCMQYPIWSPALMRGFPGYSEDCLYMNIWVPEPMNKTRTVMYWIYGGGFYQGANGWSIYDDSALAVIGDVIAVTINYRLGPFGFFSSGTDDAPGNMGLYDALMGLQWVHENINAFGGNPEEITVYGSSGGSFITAGLSVSPLARNLYKRAIMGSGAPMLDITYVQRSVNVNTSQELAERLQCSNSSFTIEDHSEEVVNCLRSISSEHLLSEDRRNYLYSEFHPQYGDEAIPISPRKVMLDGDFKNNDLLIGITNDEAALEPLLNDTLRAELYNITLPPSFPDPYKLERSISKIVGSPSCDKVCRLSRVLTDMYFICPCAYFAETYAKNNNTVYFYFFSHRPTNSTAPSWAGAVHADDTAFVHGEPAREPENYTPEEAELSLRMMKAWTNFAKTGRPDENWPLYSRRQPWMRILDTSSTISDTLGRQFFTCNILRLHFML